MNTKTLSNDKPIEYALRTWYQPEHDVPEIEQVNQAILQLQSESGELAALWAKHLYKPNRTMTRENVMDELGDVWYYVRIIAYLYDISLDELTEANRQKLEDGHGWNGSHKKIHARLETFHLETKP